MENNNGVARYKKELKKHMPCFRQRRNTLIQNFDNMLNVYLSENNDASYPHLVSAFGLPELMAEELMKDVPASEIKAQRIKRVLLIIIPSLLLAFVIGVIIYAVAVKNSAISIKDTIVIYENIDGEQKTYIMNQ